MDPTGRFGAENSNKNLMRPLDNRDSTYEFVVTRYFPVLRKICASPQNWYLRQQIPYSWKGCEVMGAPALLVELARRCALMVSGVQEAWRTSVVSGAQDPWRTSMVLGLG